MILTIPSSFAGFSTSRGIDTSFQGNLAETAAGANVIGCRNCYRNAAQMQLHDGQLNNLGNRREENGSRRRTIR